MSETARYEGRDLEAMSFAHNYHAWILQEFAPFLGKKIAEIGAGSGNFSSLLLQLPIDELLAVEPSKEMYQLLREYLGADPRVTPKHAFFTDISEQHKGHFDSVLYVNVLEHIQDDQSELRHAREALKEGGALCIFVPALQWLFGEHDRSVGHKRRYYKNQLRAIIENNGFEIIKIHYFDIAGVLPWLILMRLLKKRVSGNDAAFYDAVVVPIMSRLETVVHPPIGKNLVAIARKKS